MYLPRPLISHLYTNLIRSYHPLSPPVLLLVALEPDSLCACRIITALLKRDYIPHKIQPVSGYADLSKAGEELVRPMKTTEGGSGGLVICLGVGGLVDLGALLGLEGEESSETMCGVEVWVLDARRPYNLDNVFGGQPIEAPLGDIINEARPRARGVEKGCIQKSYKSGKGGIIVFDDGDIAGDLETERNAYCALAEMPQVDQDESDGDDEREEEEGAQDSSSSRKRKSWSDRDKEGEDSEGDEERPRQRRRSNSGSSIGSPRSRSPSSSQPVSPASKPQSPKPQTAIQLRRRLRKLREEHESVLRQYSSLGTSYSEPVSTLAYSLASDLGREDNDILWLAIIGVTSLELSGHTSTGLGTDVSREMALPHEQHRGWRTTRSSQTYALLRDEVRRLNPPPADQSPAISPGTGGSSSPSDTSIRLTPDPRFLLLRHWSLYDSMMHSPYLASRLHIWNESGVKRLHKLLAKMGVSLTQCKQTYTHMDMDLKKTLRDRLLKYAGVYGLDGLVPSGSGRAAYEQEGWGFIRSWGWKAQLSAVDVGVILGAILDVGINNMSTVSTMSSSSTSYATSSQQTSTSDDIPERSETLLPRFFAAYDALAPNHPTHLLTAIPAAQHLLRSILRTGSSLLMKHQIRHLRAFRMGVVKEGPDLALFANSPGALVKLALWVGEAIAVSERDKSGREPPTPLVLAALDEARGTYIVVGTGGGVGGGEDIETRKEKEERRKRREEQREKKRKIREEKRAARKAQRELLGDDSDAEEEDTESESEPDSESDDDQEDEAEQERRRKRGYGHNRFGIAFQEVVGETNARVRIDSFDHCLVEVKKEDLAGFLEGLSLKAVVGR
ncbi:cell division control protein 45 [Cladophialophora psammophila CBS 110553]|uniref:Cell division control protein 45 n=1 Tax=Cladophialophora psammophila CBS 110553 TaxID=1182543 RepID=W9XB71_9EURO|nr:cell division control protein 45 [Cladophialophora psammophila CBS 110553]EXJ67684.1 cell division control protein 45 [Cladophialophora psammophila CBS 110553]